MSRPSSVNQTRTILLAIDDKNSVFNELAGGQPNPGAYTAYGWQSAQQAVASHIGFNGELSERMFGWYLLGKGYRAYNTRLMRFHSPDSWSPFGKGGLNAYGYCGGDPRNFTDPTGHMFKSLFGLKKAGKTLNNAQSTSSLSPLIPPSSSPKVSKLSRGSPIRPSSESIQNSTHTGNPRDPSTGESIYDTLPAGRRTWTPPSTSPLPEGMMTFADMTEQQGLAGRTSTSVLASETRLGPMIDRSNKPLIPLRTSPSPKPLHPFPDEALSINSHGVELIDLEIYRDSIRN